MIQKRYNKHSNIPHILRNSKVLCLKPENQIQFKLIIKYISDTVVVPTDVCYFVMGSLSKAINTSMFGYLLVFRSTSQTSLMCWIS